MREDTQRLPHALYKLHSRLIDGLAQSPSPNSGQGEACCHFAPPKGVAFLQQKAETFYLTTTATFAKNQTF
jgi:hypothetical protein